MATISFDSINYVNSKDSKNFDKLFEDKESSYKFVPSKPTSQEEIAEIQRKAKLLLCK